jgi:hypothetical protein
VAILRAKVADEDVVATSKMKGIDPASTDASMQTVATRPTSPYIVAAVMVALVGYFVGLHLQHLRHPVFVDLPQLGSGINVLVVLYVLAQAIERMLVPVSWIGGGLFAWIEPRVPTSLATRKRIQQNRQAKVLALANADTAGMADAAQSAVNASYEAQQYAANLTATSFGIASAVASIVVGYTGAFLLVSAGLLTNAWLDLLVSSLAIAGGAKLLSVVISNLGSRARRPAQARATGSPSADESGSQEFA